MTTPFKRPALVEVEWLDSMALPGWRAATDKLADLDDAGALRHCTAGYLVRQDRRYVAVALSIGQAGNIGDTLQIPRQAVVRVDVLRKATRG